MRDALRGSLDCTAVFLLSSTESISLGEESNTGVFFLLTLSYVLGRRRLKVCNYLCFVQAFLVVVFVSC